MYDVPSGRILPVAQLGCSCKRDESVHTTYSGVNFKAPPPTVTLYWAACANEARARVKAAASVIGDMVKEWSEGGRS